MSDPLGNLSTDSTLESDWTGVFSPQADSSARAEEIARKRGLNLMSFADAWNVENDFVGIDRSSPAPFQLLTSGSTSPGNVTIRPVPFTSTSRLVLERLFCSPAARLCGIR